MNANQHIRSVISFLILSISVSSAISQHTFPTKEWPVANPSEVGLITDSLEALNAKFKSGVYGYADEMLIIRHGKIAYQRSYKHDYHKVFNTEARLDNSKENPQLFDFEAYPYYKNTKLHTLQSVTKTIISIVIGIAVSRNEFPDLNTPVLSFFDTTNVKNIDAGKRRITIRHLLTMTSGLQWNPDTDFNKPDIYNRVEYTINKPMSDEPGTTFNYNEGNTQILSWIFEKHTGKKIEEYTIRNLFTPLGIKEYHWQKNPDGSINCERGLYLSSADLAKIFYLYLKNGKWEQQQLVKPEWIKESVKPSIKVNDYNDYGFQWWMFTYDGTKKPIDIWAGNGYGDQVPMIVPELDMVIIFTGWNILNDKPKFDYWQINKLLFHSIVDTDVNINKIAASSNGIEVKLTGTKESHEIYYTLDGSNPTPQASLSKGPLVLKKSAVVKTKAFTKDEEVSTVSEKKFIVHKGLDASISLANPISPKYPGDEGSKTLLNSVAGPVGYANPEWVGFEGKNLDATILFPKATSISKISLNSINQPLSWVHPALKIEVFWKKPDGSFEKTGEIETVINPEKIISSGISFPAVITDQIRVVVHHRIIPEGNPGAGYPAWLFVDELVIE